MGFARFYKVYKLCKSHQEAEIRESRWSGAWISYIVLRILAGIKDNWESFARSLGVIESGKNQSSYTRTQRRRDLKEISSLGDVFAAHDWSQPEEDGTI